MRPVSAIVVETEHGPARAELAEVDGAVGAVVLGHGAGGGIAAPDLVATRDVAVAAGLSVALVEQPYRVAGRRSPAPAWQLDVAWVNVVDELRRRWLGELPLVVGGRSSGARVACRTSGLTRAVGVLCLAFPLQPPQGSRPEPRPSRLAELEIVAVPTLVVQGERDPYEIPPASGRRAVVLVPGDHSLRQGLGDAAPAVDEWLRRVTLRGKGAASARPAKPSGSVSSPR